VTRTLRVLVLNERDLDLAINLVTGRITDPEGEPVAGARVRAQRSSSGGGSPQIRMVMIDGRIVSDRTNQS